MWVRIKRKSSLAEDPRVRGWIHERRVREGEVFEISDEIAEDHQGFNLYKQFSFQIMEALDGPSCIAGCDLAHNHVSSKPIKDFQHKWKKGTTPKHLEKPVMEPIAPPMEVVKKTKGRPSKPVVHSDGAVDL